MTMMLNADQIAEASLAARQGMLVDVIASTPSTNTALRERIATLSAPMLLAAELQTAGRGRAGRSWHSAPGDSLCFSLAWRLQASIERLSGLSLAVGVTIAETLGAFGWPVQLKWPNDLLIGGEKLGGILIETAQQAAAKSSPRWAVIGVGLNVRPNRERDAALDHAVATLQTAAPTGNQEAAIDRNKLLATLADALSASLSIFDREGLSCFVARWQALHLHQDQNVRIVEKGVVLYEGIAHGIDDSGRLMLDTSAGRVAVATGDVSLRPFNAAVSQGGAHAAAD